MSCCHTSILKTERQALVIAGMFFRFDHEMYHLPAYFVNPFYNVVVRLIVRHNLLEIKLVPYPV